MPKNSAKSVDRQLPKSIGKKEEKLRELRPIINSERSKKFKREYLLAPIIPILVLAAVAGFFVLKSKSYVKTSTDIISPESSTSLQSTQEAKLKEVYKKETNVDLKNFVPRYSVYEDPGISFRISYPVGFTPTSESYGVRLTRTNDLGSIDVYASQDSSQVKVNSNGLSSKDVDVLNAAADFIRSTYESIAPVTYDKNTLKQRFSNGTDKSHY